MKKSVVNIILALAVAGVSFAWYVDHSNSNQELRDLRDEHIKEMEAFQKRYDKLLDEVSYLEGKAADEKTQLNETKQQITKVQVVDISTIPPNARADSIRAIISRD